MSHALDHLDLIKEALRQPPLGLITDVDGTISPTAPTPKQAKVSPLCRRYLSLLCRHLALVAAVSGRPAIEVKNMIGIDAMLYIGNHGLERWKGGHPEYTREAQAYSKVIKAAIEELNRLLPIEGVYIEDKRVTATIHYRLCREPQSVKKQILTVVKNLPQIAKLQIVQEKMAIDLIPPIEANKGTATMDLIREYGLKSGLYLGDDFTDIDAFRAIRTASRGPNFHGFAIGIISQEMPRGLLAEVDFTLNGINDVERFLKWMSQVAHQLG